MGRQGSRLLPFLQKGMINKKYRNLISEDPYGIKFSIVLPHKTKRLQKEDEHLFKDWYSLNGKKYVFHSKHYTYAKQSIIASLRKSDYVVKVHINDHKLTYRILNKAEIKENKRLKKELKKLKEIEKASDSDAASSSLESGYGSGPDSPFDDQAQLSLNDNLTPPSCNESSYVKEAESPQNDYAEGPLNDNSTIQSGYKSPMLNSMETNNLFVTNDVLLSTFSDEFFKLEPMEASISADDLQPFAGDLKSADYFAEDAGFAPHNMDLMDCTPEATELRSSCFEGPLASENENSYDFLNLDSLYFEEPDISFCNDVPSFNANPPMLCENKINNQGPEIMNENGLPTEPPEDIFNEELWNKIIEALSAIDFNSSAAFERSQEEISSSPDAGLSDQKNETEENIYLCKNCIHLGRIPILFCEPQFERKTTTSSSEFKIVFEEAVLKEINGFKCVKEWKFINYHLMVILEPNDD